MQLSVMHSTFFQTQMVYSPESNPNNFQTKPAVFYFVFCFGYRMAFLVRLSFFVKGKKTRGGNYLAPNRKQALGNRHNESCGRRRVFFGAVSQQTKREGKKENLLHNIGSQTVCCEGHCCVAKHVIEFLICPYIYVYFLIGIGYTAKLKAARRRKKLSIPFGCLISEGLTSTGWKCPRIL